jgi:hypothetical protein
VIRYRKLYPLFWEDEKVQALDAFDKLLAVYIFAGPQSNRIGLYCLSPGMAEDYTGIPLTRVGGRVGGRVEGVDETMPTRVERVCQHLGWKWDPTTRVVYIPTWWKYNAPENPSVMIGSLDDLDSVPHSPLVARFCENVTYLKPPLHETLRTRVGTRVGGRVGRPAPHQEQEQEQEGATPSPSPSARTALLPDDAIAVEAEAVEVPRVGSARPAVASRVVAAAALAPDLAANGAPPAATSGRPDHLKIVRPEPEEFTTFYAIYSRRTARTEALKAWRKLAPDAALVAQIMAAVEAQKAPAPKPGNTLAPTDGPAYIPYPASWLNGKRWTDEIISAAPTEGSTPSPARHLLAEFGRLFESKVTFAYVGNTDRDLKILEELLAQRNGRGESAFPPATLQRLMKGFFKYPPQWVRDKDRFDVPTFKTVFPELTRMLSKGDI